jgi:UDP-3-O-[3-hydroxymyristoyl] N-acetylglucosamine deacetylase
MQQRTLGSVVRCRGVGLHTGDSVGMVLRPAAPGTGIVFRRVDAGVQIPAIWQHAVETPLCTTLANGEGVEVKTVEHLMAAFAGSAIDNVIVELDGPEVPVMDGSAAPFMALIERAGVEVQGRIRRAIKVLKPVRVDRGGATVALFPDHGFSMSFQIAFDNPVIRHQDMMLPFEPDTFRTELSGARSFCLFDEIERMRAAGLARGGSLDNAVVVGTDGVLNEGGLRFPDEFVRHKLLDAFGDLYLAGGPIIGHFHGSCSGHAHTRLLLKALFADPQAWCATTLASAPMARPGRVAWPEAARLAVA